MKDGDADSLVSSFGSGDTITNLAAQKFSDRQAAVDDLTEVIQRHTKYFHTLILVNFFSFRKY